MPADDGAGWIGAWIDTRRWGDRLATAGTAGTLGFALHDGRGERIAPAAQQSPAGLAPQEAAAAADGAETARAPVPGTDWQIVALRPPAARDARRRDIVAGGLLWALLAALGAAAVAFAPRRARGADDGPGDAAEAAPGDRAPPAAAAGSEPAAAAARRARQELLALLDHDLRNLLNTLLAAVEVTGLAAADADARREARATAARQARRLERLLQDLKSAADGAGGGAAARTAASDLAAAAHRALEGLRQRWTEDLPAGAAAPPPPRVRAATAVWAGADAAQVEQIVAAAVDHVRKTLPPQEAIAVDVFDDGDRAVLEVQAAAESPRLAVDWHGACDATAVAQARHRCGLALTLACDLAQRWQGALLSAASATPGQGARLRLELPRAAAPARVPAGAAGAVAAAGRPAAARRVLIVEHDPAERMAMQGVLVAAGHQVGTAADGAAGLRALLQQRPEVALIDMGLPEIDGLQLARLSRGAGYGGRLVAMRARGGGADLHQARRAGFDALLEEPTDPEQLRCAVAAPS